MTVGVWSAPMRPSNLLVAVAVLVATVALAADDKALVSEATATSPRATTRNRRTLTSDFAMFITTARS